MRELEGIDILVSNAAFQMTHETIEEIPDEEWDFTIATNLSAFFHLSKAAVPPMEAGASIIATSSINYQQPSPQLLPYAVTKAGIANMSANRRRCSGPGSRRSSRRSTSCSPATR